MINKLARLLAFWLIDRMSMDEAMGLAWDIQQAVNRKMLKSKALEKCHEE